MQRKLSHKKMGPERERYRETVREDKRYIYIERDRERERERERKRE